MRFDSLNHGIENTREANIHDSIVLTIQYDYYHNTILFESKDDWGRNVIYSLLFNNVIGFEMMSCDFWGKSPHVFDWGCEEKTDQYLINRLFAEKNTHNYMYSRLEDKDKYIEAVIDFTSGDKLRVACEYIIFEERSI